MNFYTIAHLECALPSGFITAPKGGCIPKQRCVFSEAKDVVSNKMYRIITLEFRGEIKYIVIDGFIGQGILGIGTLKEVHLTFHTNQLHKIKGVG